MNIDVAIEKLLPLEIAESIALNHRAPLVWEPQFVLFRHRLILSIDLRSAHRTALNASRGSGSRIR